ncbi:MAG: universal stress protein [Candidatus Promineifilaceae bacterium]|nr:universal stress protein [Candidatus Promineifilaceae bacterium]
MAELGYLEALEDFRRVRRQAALQHVLARLTGRTDQLLSYEEVRRRVGARGTVDRGLQEIPLEAIIGSVGRYGDFTRTFLPRSDSMQERWARVKTVATKMGGWPPIEVYQLGDTYFVLDGNHRVSVARQMGMKTIPAYVTEVKTAVSLHPDTDPEELIIKERYAHFLKTTGLDLARPEADLTATEPGAYRLLQEHIDVHRYYMGLEQQRDIGYQEAVVHWYDEVYVPVVAIIREKGLLHDFPNRTETDLYLWLAEHRAELEEVLGWQIQPGAAAEDLAHTQSSRRERILSRVGEKLWEAVTLSDLEPGPPTGAWRTKRVAGRRDERLFLDIVVTLNGEESGWLALEQALTVCRREDGNLRALHVTADEGGRESEAIAALRDRFQWRLGEVGLEGELVVETGPVVATICDRARWNDLVVMPLNHPPGKGPLDRLSSGFRQVVQRCARPILAVSQHASPLDRALLAYDGSTKAEEALFVATYLAGQWGIALVVVAVDEERTPKTSVMDRARDYLVAHDVTAEYVVKRPPTAAAIMATADQYNCDFMIMGGYSARPVVEIVLGSTLNDVLSTTHKPVLICR